MARVPTNIRLPDAVLTRADALVPRLGEATELATAVTITRSDVLRAALAIGLDTLEKRYGAQPALPGVEGGQ